jgi:hypothetical protein
LSLNLRFGWLYRQRTGVDGEEENLNDFTLDEY